MRLVVLLRVPQRLIDHGENFLPASRIHRPPAKPTRLCTRIVLQADNPKMSQVFLQICPQPLDGVVLTLDQLHHVALVNQKSAGYPVMDVLTGGGPVNRVNRSL